MANPIEEHKDIINKLVRRTDSISANLVRKEGIFTKSKNEQNLNALVQRLNEDDRELLAQMLQKERIGGIHDVLVVINEECDINGLKLVKDGGEIPHEPFGYTMFQEYITLLDGDWSELEE